jgi:hypothetical protein
MEEKFKNYLQDLKDDVTLKLLLVEIDSKNKNYHIKNQELKTLLSLSTNIEFKASLSNLQKKNLEILLNRFNLIQEKLQKKVILKYITPKQFIQNIIEKNDNVTHIILLSSGIFSLT